MILNLPILSIITFLPILGVLFLCLIRGDKDIVCSNSKLVGLWVSGFNFFLSILIYLNFDNSNPNYQFEEQYDWILHSGISYHFGIDGISLPFVLLSSFLTPFAILASWNSIKYKVREYIISFLILETMMIGMFVSLDMFMFYLFFEGVLIPMFLIIGIWGGARKIYAAFKFFLYTLLGSVLMLICMLVMYSIVGTTDIPKLSIYEFSSNLQYWLFLGFFASFCVKVPMWPFHTWLPDAHVEAPTAGSMILAGVLLKMGGYGFIRFSLPMFPIASEFFAPFIFILSIIAIIYTSLVALIQTDMKKLIAYSSVAHMGFVTIGIFSLNHQGLAGAIFQMISHGLVSSALFFSVGVIYDRFHTREISSYSGLAYNMPKYAIFFMLMMLASVGLPGTSGFVGEILVLVGAWNNSNWVAIFAATGLVLGATYMLWLYRRIIFGNLNKNELKDLLDLDYREMLVYIPISIFIILLGIYPLSLLDILNPTLNNFLSTFFEGLN